VTLPRVKGENATQRNARVAREKVAALLRQCDFCAPSSLAVLEPQLATVAAVIEPETPATLSEVFETELELLELAADVATEVDVARPDERQESDALELVEVDEVVVVVEPTAPREPRARRTRRTIPVATSAHVATPPESAKRYAVRYQAELVIRAASLQEALRQAAAIGATDVLAISRQD
jgi:hypothetical protein